MCVEHDMDFDRSVSAAKALQAARLEARARLREQDSVLVAGSRRALARSHALLERTRPMTATLAAAPDTAPSPVLADLAASDPILVTPPAPAQRADGEPTPPKRRRCTTGSLRVVLSPTEESALRRIAHCSLAKLQPPAVERLRQLNLIEMHRGAYTLTPLGQRRFERLPKPARLATDSQVNGLLRILDSVRHGQPKT
jgi:hypothetical protein